MRIQYLLALLLVSGCGKEPTTAALDKYPALPRRPPAHSFTSLGQHPFNLGAQDYLAIVPTLERYREVGPDGPENKPPWRDELRFAKWLEQQAIPRSLAEFLYLHSPERTLMINAGYLDGVADLIDANSAKPSHHIRAAGFFIVGSGSNGDFLVVDLEREGATGFLPLELVFSKNPKELRELFITIAPSLGTYLKLTELSNDTPRDYWASKKWLELRGNESGDTAKGRQ